MAHNLYFNGKKQDLIYHNLEPQSTVRNNKTSSDTPDYVSGTGIHEMLKNSISYVNFGAFLEQQSGTQSVTYTYSASKFNSNFFGYNSDGTIKNGYFFPVTSGVINPNNKATLAKFSNTLISGFIIIYFNPNDVCLYKEFNNELLPFTVTFTYNDAIKNMNNKTKVELTDAEKTKLFTPTVIIEQSENKNTGYALSMTATTSQTTIIQDNHCGVQLNSVKQIKLDSWDDYTTSTGTNIIETNIEGSTYEENYVRLYHLSNYKKFGDSMSEDFTLPISKLDDSDTVINSAYISGFICLSTVYPENTDVSNRYIYLPTIDLKAIKDIIYIYGEKFYNNYEWGVRLDPTTKNINCYVVSNTLVSSSTYIVVDAYIYQYGKATRILHKN